MSYIKEQVSYLRGLAEGLTIGDDKQAQVIHAIIALLDDMASYIDENQAVQEELMANLENLTEDVQDLEEAVFEDDEVFEVDESWTKEESSGLPRRHYEEPIDRGKISEVRFKI